MNIPGLVAVEAIEEGEELIRVPSKFHITSASQLFSLQQAWQQVVVGAAGGAVVVPAEQGRHFFLSICGGIHVLRAQATGSGKSCSSTGRSSTSEVRISSTNSLWAV